MTRKVYYDGNWVTLPGEWFDFSKKTVYPATSGSPATYSTVLLPNPASPHTKTPTSGSWTQIIASTVEDIDLLVFWLVGSGSSADPTGALVDIGIGAGGSEVAIVENVAALYNFGVFGTAPIVELPVHIPAGSRVSVRWQTAHPTVLTSVSFNYQAFGSTSDPAPSSLVTIGANTATTGGVSLGTTADTFIEVVASTAADYKGIVMTFTTNDSDLLVRTVSADMGVGPSFDTIIASCFSFSTGTSELTANAGGMGSNWIKRFIPAGSRIGVKLRSSTVGVTDNFECVLLGLPV